MPAQSTHPKQQTLVSRVSATQQQVNQASPQQVQSSQLQRSSRVLPYPQQQSRPSQSQQTHPQHPQYGQFATSGHAQHMARAAAAVSPSQPVMPSQHMPGTMMPSAPGYWAPTAPNMYYASQSTMPQSAGHTLKRPSQAQGARTDVKRQFKQQQKREVFDPRTCVVCNKQATCKCSICGVKYYCSRDCQVSVRCVLFVLPHSPCRIGRCTKRVVRKRKLVHERQQAVWPSSPHGVMSQLSSPHRDACV